MLYIVLDNNHLRLLVLRKSLLGQFEVDFFEKKHEIQLLRENKAVSVDIIASAIKEAVTHAVIGQEKEVFLVLPQGAFEFFRTEIPSDLTSSALHAFVQDKARAHIMTPPEQLSSCYFVKANSGKTDVSYFAMDKMNLDVYREACHLLGLKLVAVVPDTMASFKLFEKTLRQEKRENILYVSLEPQLVRSFLFDSSGPQNSALWEHSLGEGETAESVLKTKIDDFNESNTKINRIVLSGADSEQVRQDTFTKNVGAWTNPLKRIIPNFYDEYVKMLVIPTGKAFPVLTYDLNFGAFLLSQENKDFNVMKKQSGSSTMSTGMKSGSSKVGEFAKTLFYFVAAFAITVGVIYGISKIEFKNIKIPLITKTTPTPTPLPPAATPTPTPSYKKEEVKIKVLNGSGTRGKATEIKDMLKTAGFEEILTGNADNFDYTTSVIQVKDSMKEVVPAVEKALAETGVKPKIEKLDEKDVSDVIFIFGADVK